MALEGDDLSHWQGTNAVDGAPNFVILKATDGDNYVDPDCDNKYQRAKGEGKLLGVYHYAEMGDPVAEATYFANNTAGYWQKREAILVLDNETHTDVGWALKWLQTVEALTGVKPLIYMSASTIKAVDWTPVVNNDNGLWVAGYPAKYNVSNPVWTDGSDLPYDISPWNFAAIWQFTSSAGKLDEDVAMMSATAWGLYAGQGVHVPVPTPPAPVITTGEVTVTNDIPFDSNTISDPTKDNTFSEVTQVGVDGVETVVYTVTYSDGTETGRVVASDTITTPAVPEITTVGTKVPAPVVDPTPDPTPNPEPSQNPMVVVFEAVVKFLTDLVNSFKESK